MDQKQSCERGFKKTSLCGINVDRILEDEKWIEFLRDINERLAKSSSNKIYTVTSIFFPN